MRVPEAPNARQHLMLSVVVTGRFAAAPHCGLGLHSPSDWCWVLFHYLVSLFKVYLAYSYFLKKCFSVGVQVSSFPQNMQVCNKTGSQSCEGILCRCLTVAVPLYLLFSVLQSNLSIIPSYVTTQHLIHSVSLSFLLWKNWAVSWVWVIINTGKMTGRPTGLCISKRIL